LAAAAVAAAAVAAAAASSTVVGSCSLALLSVSGQVNKMAQHRKEK